MKRSVLLSTFLFAAVLTPMLLQTNYCNLEKYPKLATLELWVPDIDGEDVTSDFNPDYILYEVELPADESHTAVLFAEAQDAAATIEVTYDSQPIPLGSDGLASLTLAPDHSELKVRVLLDANGDGGPYYTYTISIDRRDPCHWLPDASPCSEGKGECYGGLCNFVPVSVTLGAKEVVFDWTADRCEELDIPDGPARAVRGEDGEIVIFATHYSGNYLSRGADFGTLERVCDPPPLVSAELPTPESYENFEWLWSPYRVGASWHVLIHNEFHDATSINCSPTNLCWYNSITYAVSTDGARSFAKPSPPAHVVAPAPRVWTPPDTPLQDWYVDGYFEPTNIVLGPDGYYYALMKRMRIDSTMEIDIRGVCAMRTKTLNDPASWRAWDGSDFNLPLTSPYLAGGDVPECERVGLPPGLGAQSLSFNTYLGRYMSVDSHFIWEAGKQVCGFVFSTSLDLIHWSDPQLIAPARVGCGWMPGELEPVEVAYPSIIDHVESSANFERPGRTPHLYYTRNNGNGGLDRDLVRVPLKFTVGGALCEGVDCDDQNECTQEVCNGVDGSCEYEPIDCADSNDCTIDTCNPTIGCEHAVAANGTPCGGGLGTCEDGACAAMFPCSEQGILDAIALGGGPHTFDCATPTTVVTTAEIAIDNDVVLDGGGNLTVDGNGDHRVFSVAAGVNAELIDLTVTGGSGSDVGGGILNAGTLSLTDVTISGNTAANIGGGLSSQPGATATLVRTTIEGNSVTRGSGGGVGNDGTMTLINTTVRGNQVRWHGGGIFQNGSMALISSTVSGNSAVYGGAIWAVGGSLVLTNSTVSSNVATEASGGGIVNEASMTLISSTIAANSAVGIGSAIWNTGEALSRDTVIAGDCGGTSAVGSFGPSGGNIESPGDTCFAPYPGSVSSVPASVLNLGSLADNGGATQTHTPGDGGFGTGSVAIDWISEVDCLDANGAPLTTDQRGEPRPETGGTMCDVGSVEVQP